MMKLTQGSALCILTVVLAPAGLEATAIQPDPPRPRITVRIRDHAEAPKRMLRSAADTARRIFLAAGVETVWLDCGARGADEVRDQRCLQKSGAADIQLRILHKRQAKKLGLSRAALGYALVPPQGHGSIANVFFHRVEEIARWTGVDRALVFGHIMAHEVGHLLLDKGGHSSNGMMRSAWDKKDLLRPAAVSLRFGPEEAERIRRNVRERMGDESFQVSVGGEAGRSTEGR